MNNLKATFNNNPTSNKYWIAGKVIESVKAGSTDIYVVCADESHFEEVKSAIRSLSNIDNDFNKLVKDNNVMYHYCPLSSLECLTNDDVTAKPAFFMFNIFEMPVLKQIAYLSRLNVKAFISSVPGMIKNIPLNVDIEF